MGKKHKDKETTKAVDYRPLVRDALEWALEIAAASTRDVPEEAASVARVKQFVRARLAGDSAHIHVDDMLFTIGLIAGAIQRDLRSLAAVGRARAMQLPHAFGPALWFGRGHSNT